MSILVITTGGTIGAMPYDDPRKPPKLSVMPADTDNVREALSSPQFAFAKTRCLSFEPRDSKLIDVSYQEKILKEVIEATEKRVVITFGTDRMLDMADYFDRQFKANADLTDKIIFLTGAMTPLANGPASDGYLNLAYSLQHVVEQSPGVYIVLCDYADEGAWQPRLYPYQPNKYEKAYDSKDGSRSRLRQRA